MVNVSAAPTLSMTGTERPKLYLAGDLGKSACKFLYWSDSIEFHPLWLGSDIVEGVSDAALRKFDAAGDLAEAAWMRVGERNILVGNSATGYGSSFAADKANIAAYQIAAALGLAAIALEASQYHAVVWLTIPLNEFRYKAEIDAKLRMIGEAFVFCDRSQQFTLAPSFYPEGTGLYLLHKKNREQLTGNSYTRRVIVLMMGHRNLSTLVFENGKLNASLSQTSDTLGFWGNFRADASTVGVREADFPSLLAAVTSGEARQLSPVAGGFKDFTLPVESVKQGILQRFEPFCQDHVLKLLLDGTPTDVVLGGGVAHVMREPLRDYFANLGVTDNLYFMDGTGGRLLTLAAQTRNAYGDLARPMRFADVYGLAQALTGQINRGR